MSQSRLVFPDEKKSPRYFLGEKKSPRYFLDDAGARKGQ